MAQIIAVLTPKGGVGKSTLATNLACGLQAHGNRKVLIADTDSHVQSASAWREQAGEDSTAPRVVSINQPSVPETLQAISSGFDYIIIDGLAHDHKMLASSVKAADLVLIPVRPSAVDFWGADDLIEIIMARQNITDGRPKAAFVVSQQIVGTNLAKSIDDLLSLYPEIPVLEGRTSQRVAYTEALSFGQSVLEYAPGSKAAREVSDITQETLKHLNGQ